jgi:hypothetical protein
MPDGATQQRRCAKSSGLLTHGTARAVVLRTQGAY